MAKNFQKIWSRGHWRSTKVRKRKKGQIKNLIKSIQIICQNEAIDLSLSELSVSRSFKTIEGQKSRKTDQERTNFKFYQALTN